MDQRDEERALVGLDPRVARDHRAQHRDPTPARRERAFLNVSSAAARVESAALDGVWLPDGPFRHVGYGLLDPQGALTVTLTTPNLPAGGTSDLLHMQPVLVDGLGHAHLGCASIVIRLDAPY